MLFASIWQNYSHAWAVGVDVWDLRKFVPMKKIDPLLLPVSLVWSCKIYVIYIYIYFLFFFCVFARTSGRAGQTTSPNTSCKALKLTHKKRHPDTPKRSGPTRKEHELRWVSIPMKKPPNHPRGAKGQTKFHTGTATRHRPIGKETLDPNHTDRLPPDPKKRRKLFVAHSGNRILPNQSPSDPSPDRRQNP